MYAKLFSGGKSDAGCSCTAQSVMEGVIEASESELDPEPELSGGVDDDDDENKGRKMCWNGCGRPSSVCLCAHLPPDPLPTATRILILHHPHELRRNPLATVPVLTRCLRDCHALPGRRLRPGSSPLLDSLHHRPASATALLLFPGAGATDLARWAAETPPAARADPVLIVFDGTWRHAREMVAASLPFLSGFARRVSLGCDEGAEGDSTFESGLVLRKEPFRGCVSTMEAVARAIRVLEPDGAGAAVEERLLSVLQAMVRFQARHLKPVKPRPRMRKKKEMKQQKEEEVVDDEGTVC